MIHNDAWPVPCDPLIAPDPCVVVTLGGVEIASDDAPFGVHLSGWSGWTGGPMVSASVTPWESRDGAARGDVLMRPRAVTMSGQIHGRSAEDLAEMVEELSVAGLAERWSTMTVYEQHLGLERQVTVARTGPADIEVLTPTIATWTLSVQADDWRRVGVDQQSLVVPSGGAVARNLGDAPAALTLSLKGPLTDPGISWSGGAWQYSGTVASGQEIRVDMERRTVRDPATTEHFRRYASGTWLSLPPGNTTLTCTGTGSGTVTASWRSSWM